MQLLESKKQIYDVVCPILAEGYFINSYCVL